MWDWFRATPLGKKEWVLFGTACYKFMSVKNKPLSQQYVIYSTPFRRAVHAYSLSKDYTLRPRQPKTGSNGPSAWQTPSNFRHFHDNLYHTQLSGCSTFPESRLQSLPHPYSPLRANTFLRISRNRVQATSRQVIHISTRVSSQNSC